MARIFLTGASGYIGGDILHALKSAFPQFEYAALLRNAVKGGQVSSAYPDVRVVQGDLDATSVIEEEARRADIVVHAASTSHVKSVEAIYRGLTAPGRDKNGVWLQISGATVLSVTDIEKKAFGEPSDKVYSDLDGAEELRAHIRRYSAKRIVDNFVLDLPASPTRPKTALVFPPIIYGRGRGPVNQRSIQIPELARVSMQRRAGFQVGKGESIWSNVHIGDVSSIFVKLVEKALQGDNGDLWNENGLYFPGTGDLPFKGISQQVTQELHRLGLVESPSVDAISHDEADKLSPHGGILWGTNAQEQSQRARSLLGWNPTGKSLEEEIPDTIQLEAKRLGLK
ncbi:NAD dependent epimerase/dehydratase family protein [Aspergillus steynii IBT 23096]|uniref:NAD dependent epimerase/dehydratase family protein n=1 Tax=Aspergillus steynii IBT 23096 TaxID=1392250 RepID=A0A2I2GLP2_9EURO|nr:NAD dependent epimerase/dehydratase family protein [Aspergillus steynii IBT 23096]PLB53801.1 NAD dependent epimerase/dehydratase family protein [Aspergillus steynii IBT 23096]